MIATERRLRNVVIVLDNANVDGGSAKVALSSATALADLGYRVDVCSAVAASEKTRTSMPTSIHFWSTDQLEVLKDPSVARAAARGIWNADSYRLIRDVLRPFDARTTVVHVHGWTKALSSSAIRAVLDGGFTLAIGLHEYFTICPIGSLFDHRRGEICRRTPMSLDCMTANCDSRSYAHKAYRVVRQVVTNMAGGVPAKVKNFIAVSEFSRKILEPQLPPESRIFDIANPVDVPLAERVDVSSNDHYVFVGRLSHEKGPILFAEAVRRLGARAIFAGDGELHKEVRAILPEAEITGWLDRAGLADVFRRARAIVVPSLWYETFGLVVLEAAGAGIPAVVPDECAARNLIVENETGLEFRTGEIDSLEAAMRKCEDPATVARLGHEAYRRYWEHPFTLETHTRQLVEAYEAMLET